MCANSLIGVEQVMGIEPTSNPWQGLIITIILYLHKLVGDVGADPTVPEDNGFTVRRVCRFATYPNCQLASIYFKTLVE